jgi:cobalt-zinc-cadmium efflux system outer membrane protein
MRRGLLLFTALLAGCANGRDPRQDFAEVSTGLHDRGAPTLAWRQGGAEEAQADAAVRALLAKPLDGEAAVAIALLDNRELQAVYEQLGVAESELVRAGLLRNPVFTGDVRFREGGAGVDLEFTLAQDFLGIFTIPLRQRLARAELDAAKLRVSAAVIDLASRTRLAWVETQAAQQALEIERERCEAVDDAFEVASRLRAAGNIAEIDLDRRRAERADARLDLAGAEQRLADARERLTALMGVWKEDAAWTLGERLGVVPENDPSLDDIERDAVARSLELAQARGEVSVAAERAGVRYPFGPDAEIELGAHAERSSDGWAVGPTAGVPVPLYDHGQAVTAGARAQLRAAQDRFEQRAVEVRSVARATRVRLIAARARETYVRRELLPVRERLVEQTQLHYNGMLVGVFHLLEAKRREREAAAVEVDALRGYWQARAQFDCLLQGRLPPSGGDAAALPRGADGEGDH